MSNQEQRQTGLWPHQPGWTYGMDHGFGVCVVAWQSRLVDGAKVYTPITADQFYCVPAEEKAPEV